MGLERSFYGNNVLNTSEMWESLVSRIGGERYCTFIVGLVNVNNPPQPINRPFIAINKSY